MKCLTLTPEWAEAIFTLGKDVENRSRQTHYRGRLAIHAGKKLDRKLAFKLGLDPEKIVRGAIIGTVEIIGCVRNSASRWAISGAYHWLLRNPQRIKEPIVRRGQLGIWNF